MNDRIKKLKTAVEKDKEHIQKLQEGVKIKLEKIKEIENTELMNNLNSISARGIDVNDIVEAIKRNDVDILMVLMAAEQKNQSTDKTGTSSGFEIKNEENTNE